MENIKYLGTKNLDQQEIEDLNSVIDFYKPKFDRDIKSYTLTVSVKKGHILGKVGRFGIKLFIDSPQGMFHTEQTGWGLIKTMRRCGEHMVNLLNHRVKKEMLRHKPRKLNKQKK